jgi:hypothetical protein
MASFRREIQIVLDKRMKLNRRALDLENQDIS